MSLVFICYRHIDTSGHAGTIFDHLSSIYPPGQVFMDSGEPKVGEKWPDRLRLALESSAVVLCVIGGSWDSKRLWERGDFVHLEISTALGLKKPVVPLLFDRAALPTTDELPEDCREMLVYQPMAFDPWDRDLYKEKVKSLPTIIDRLVGDLYASGNRAAVSRIAFEKVSGETRNGGFVVRIDGNVCAEFQTHLSPTSWVETAVGWHQIELINSEYVVERTGSAGYRWSGVMECRTFLEAKDYSVEIRAKKWPWPLDFVGKWAAQEPKLK